MAGDPHAFTQLVERHRDRLWAISLRTLGDPEEAADALQDALISAFRHASSFRGEAAVTTWLHRIVVNACLDRLRRRAARPAVPLGDRDVVWGRDPQGQVDTALAVRAALAELPPEQREALVLVDMEDLPVAEAARMLGVPEGTVKSRCSRGRTAMAALLREASETVERPAAGGSGPDRSSGNQSDPPHVASTDADPSCRPSGDDPNQSGRW